MDLGDRDAMAVMAARMYHQSGQSTAEVARALDVSRSTVSRLLAHARETGIVRVQVHAERARGPGIRLALGERFPDVAFHVVEVSPTLSTARVLDAVAQYAAHLVVDLVEPGATVGIAWGNMLTAIVGHLQPRPVRDLDVVQLNGAGNRRGLRLRYASDIVTGFADNFGGTDHLFPVPAFFDDPVTKQTLWRERSIQRILSIQRDASLLLFSVGGLGTNAASHVYRAGYLSDAEVLALRMDGAVGDIATVFYTGDGGSELAINERSSGPPLQRYRTAPRSVCVASGSWKVHGLLGALRAGYISDLVIDERTAVELALIAAEAEVDRGASRPQPHQDAAR